MSQATRRHHRSRHRLARRQHGRHGVAQRARQARAASGRSRASTRAPFPCASPAQSPDFDAEKYLPAERAAASMDPFMHYGVRGGAQTPSRTPASRSRRRTRTRIGIAMGAGIGGLDTIEENYAQVRSRRTSPKKISPFFVPGSIINMISGHLSIKFSSPGRTSRRSPRARLRRTPSASAMRTDPVRRRGRR